MKKICLQAGHGGITTGATGAPGERDWTTSIVPMIANILKARNMDVYETGSKANEDSKVTDTDWDLFLAVHYDADIYNDRGGFCDYPDESTDAVWETSKKLSDSIEDHYFKTVGIPIKNSRSNANTKFYYMWKHLTANTPCVILECGVGWRKPEDYNTLHNNKEKVALAIADSISLALGEEVPPTSSECEQELEEMRNSRDRWKQKCSELEDQLEKERAENAKTIKEKNEQIDSLNETNAKLNESNARLNEENTKLTAKNLLLQEQVTNKDTVIAGQKEEIERLLAQVFTLKEENAKLKLKLKAGLCGYTWRERWFSLVRCKNSS